MTLRICLLAGIFAGLCSALYFVGLTLGLNPYIPLCISILVFAALVKWVRVPAGVPSKPPNLWVGAAFGVVLCASLLGFIVVWFKQPHGDWDAWAIWNLHARFLERDGGAHWTAMFAKSLNWTHPDYPLLTPALIAQIWSALRVESTIVPAAVAFLFSFGCVGIVVGAVRIVRGWDQALIAGTFLLAAGGFLTLGTAQYVSQGQGPGQYVFMPLGAAQYADVPLAFYMLAALALLFFDDVNCTVLAGAMAGFAAWTKNEGLLFVIAVVVARLIAQWRYGNGKKLVRELSFFAVGIAPVLAVLALFKFRYAPPDELVFLHQPGEVLARAHDFGRYVTAAQAFVKHLFLLGTNPSFFVPSILVLGAYAFLVGFKLDPERRTGIATILTAIAIMLLGDLAVYVLLPNDLNWQINTSLDRVLMQLWPAALLGFFAAVAKVELAPAPMVQHSAHYKEARKDARKAVAGRRH